MSVVENLIGLLRILQKQQKARRILVVEIAIHPYSCLDQDNLNFLFACVVGEDPVFKNTKIRLIRNKKFQEQEYIVENVEIEIEENNIEIT